MSHLTSESCSGLSARLNVCIVRLEPTVTISAIAHVSHYIKHGEIEMAYESLILSCIRERVRCDAHTSKELRAIGTDLSMETESVFEVDFWQIAQEYFESSANKWDSSQS